MKSIITILLSLPIVVLANIQGYNFYGMETPLKDFTCSWKHPVEYYINQLSDFGFNSIRLPFSKQYIDENDLSKMDNFITKATEKNMSILLDFHRVNSNYQSSNPFNDLTLTQFTECWVKVLNRYKNNSLVFGVGLFNEFQGSSSDGVYWSEMMKQTINKIEETQLPNRWTYFVGGSQWGGDLHYINLENQPFSSNVKYEIHKYHFSGTSTIEDWDYSFGNFTNKIVVGEWSINREAWDERFINYLIKRNIRNNYYWTISNSGDTINLWENDCETINWDVINKIKTLWSSSHRLLRGSV